MPDNHPDRASEQDRGEYSVMPVMSYAQAPATGKDFFLVARGEATGTAVKVWLDSYTSPNTQDAYRRDIRLWFDWCRDMDVDPGTARRGDVDGYARWLDDEYGNPATRARKLSAVSSFYTYWMYEGATDRNPVAHVRRPKVSDEPGSIALTKEQMRDLLAYAVGLADLRTAVIVRLLSEIGLRISELCTLQISDLGYSSGHRTITVTRKGGLRATFPLPPATGDLLSRYVEGRTSGPVLVTGTGGVYRRQYAWKLLRRIAREAGLPEEVWRRMHPHVLRHSAATILSESGRPIQDIQRMLGHADPRTTERYTHHRASLDASPVYDLAGLLAA